MSMSFSASAATNGGLGGGGKASLPVSKEKTVGGALAHGFDDFLIILNNLATHKAGQVAVNFAELAVPVVNKTLLKPLVAAASTLPAATEILKMGNIATKVLESGKHGIGFASAVIRLLGKVASFGKL